jgi:hypothetical protein
MFLIAQFVLYCLVSRSPPPDFSLVDSFLNIGAGHGYLGLLHIEMLVFLGVFCLVSMSPASNLLCLRDGVARRTNVLSWRGDHVL